MMTPANGGGATGKRRNANPGLPFSPRCGETVRPNAGGAAELETGEMASRPDGNIPLLLNAVLSGFTSLSAKDLTRLGVKAQAARTLVILLREPYLRCSTLSRMLGLEATALSHLLRSLASKQLIVRNRVENDNRAVEVGLTEKGRGVAKKCDAVARAHERRMLQGLDARDMRMLRDVLARMSDNVASPSRRVDTVAKNGPRRARSIARGRRARPARVDAGV